MQNRRHRWLIFLPRRFSHRKKQGVAALTFKGGRNLVGTLFYFTKQHRLSAKAPVWILSIFKLPAKLPASTSLQEQSTTPAMDYDAEATAFIRTWDSCRVFGSIFSKEPPPRDDPSWENAGPPTALCTCKYPCDSTFDVPRGRAGTSTGKGISKTFREIKDSADNGCVFCKYIYEEFDIRSRSQTGTVVVLKIEFAHSFGHWRFCFRFGDEMKIRKLHHYDEIYPNWLSGKNATDIAAKEQWEQDNRAWSVQQREGTAAMMMKAPGSTTSLKNLLERVDLLTQMAQLYLAKEWFDRCIHQHENCQNGRDDQFYPRRMIDVRGATPRLILLEDQDERPSGSYATLSHRWRSSDSQFNLTAENLPQFRSKIPRADVCHLQRRDFCL